MVPRVVLSLALLFSAATARCPLRFWNSMPIDAGFQISIYADSTCVGGCVKGDFWLAPEQAKPDTFGELGTLLRRSGPENAFRPLLILHRSAGGRRKSPKKTQTRLGISACRWALPARHRLRALAHVSRIPLRQQLRRCARCQRPRYRGDPQPSLQEKAARRRRAPQP